MAVDQAQLEALIHQAVNDLAASVSGIMTAIGHKLGIYRAMAGEGPMTAAELTEKIGAHERYVRERLNNQAAGGYIAYDPGQGTYELTEEQAMALANPESSAFIARLRISGQSVARRRQDYSRVSYRPWH